MFRLTAFVLLLHAFVPHVHHDDLSVAQDEAMHQDADESLLNALAVTFHESLAHAGDEFPTETDAPTLNGLVASFSSLSIDTQEGNYKRVGVFSFVMPTRGSPAVLRGPPSVS